MSHMVNPVNDHVCGVEDLHNTLIALSRAANAEIAFAKQKIWGLIGVTVFLGSSRAQEVRLCEEGDRKFANLSRIEILLVTVADFGLSTCDDLVADTREIPSCFGRVILIPGQS
jgi:hypothetical protein